MSNDISARTHTACRHRQHVSALTIVSALMARDSDLLGPLGKTLAVSALGPAQRFVSASPCMTIFYTFCGSGDWNTKTKIVRLKQSWSFFILHVDSAFLYEDLTRMRPDLCTKKTAALDPEGYFRPRHGSASHEMMRMSRMTAGVPQLCGFDISGHSFLAFPKASLHSLNAKPKP